ncbi:hypothetical protein D3C83_109480 [compost metagenome]
MVSTSTFRVRRRAKAVTSIEPSAPIDAASVGAAMPAMMDPSTDSTSPSGGSTTLKNLSHSSPRGIASRSAFGTAGTHSGFTKPSVAT